MKYKALICDLDGTLIPNKENGMPSKNVIQAIEKANKKIKVGIATARSYWQLDHILDVLLLSAPCAITGGAQIINPKTRKTYIERTISKKEVLEIEKIASKMGITCIIADRDGERSLDLKNLPTDPLDLYTNPIPIPKADAFIQEISHMSTISMHKALSWEGFGKIHVTITNPKASKQDAILEIAHLLGISTEEIIGVGEGYNDFPFLMACGFKVAMGDGVEDVKAIADYIAPTVAEDGVVDIINKFIL